MAMDWYCSNKAITLFSCNITVQCCYNMTRFCPLRSSEHSWAVRWVWVLPSLANKHTSSQTHAPQWYLNNTSKPPAPRSSLRSSYWVMMDTVFESHAQYLYLTDMRYYAYIKGWFTKGVVHWKKSQWSSLDIKQQKLWEGRELSCMQWGLLVSLESVLFLITCKLLDNFYFLHIRLRSF